MNSRKTNLRLIENITVQVPNTASISKGILFHVSKFLEKMIFQLMFEIIKWIRQLQVRRQTVPNYWYQIRQIFLIRIRVFWKLVLYILMIYIDNLVKIKQIQDLLNRRSCICLILTRLSIYIMKIEDKFP